MSMIHAGVWQAIKALWVATVHAVAVWSLLAPIAIYVIYKVLTPVFRRLAPSRKLANPEPESPVALEVC